MLFPCFSHRCPLRCTLFHALPPHIVPMPVRVNSAHIPRVSMLINALPMPCLTTPMRFQAAPAPILSRPCFAVSGRFSASPFRLSSFVCISHPSRLNSNQGFSCSCRIEATLILCRCLQCSSVPPPCLAALRIADHCPVESDLVVSNSKRVLSLSPPRFSASAQVLRASEQILFRAIRALPFRSTSMLTISVPRRIHANPFPNRLRSFPRHIYANPKLLN